MKKKIIIIVSLAVTLIIALVLFSVFYPMIKLKKTLDTIVSEDYVFEGKYYLEVDDKLFKGSYEGEKEDLNIHIQADVNGADIIDAYYAEDGEVLFNIKPFIVWLYEKLPDKLLNTAGMDKLAAKDNYVSYEQLQEILDIDYDFVTHSKDMSYSIKKLKESPFYRIETKQEMIYYEIIADEIPVSVGVYSNKYEIVLAAAVTIDDLYLEVYGNIDLSQQKSIEMPKEKLSKGVVFVLRKIISYIKEKF